jgi:hypothetical protein
MVLAGAVLAGGCGGGATITVKGEVTLDRKPLEEGKITFVPEDGKSPQVVAPIKDGKYSLKAPLGAMRVRINSYVVKGKRKAYDAPDSPLVDVLVDQIPERYNSRTELTANVTKGENVLNWDLRSKQKEKTP